jgi:hypothetical protein
MRIRHVPDRIRADGVAGLPAHALRAVYTRVGRLFLYTDRLRRQARDSGEQHQLTRDRPAWDEAGSRPGPDAYEARWRSLEQPGNVRLLPPGGPAAEPEPEPEPEAAALPVPNYDALSLPSLRARLRNLDVAQLRVLAAYERAHAGRLDVVMMFERRIAKLASQ